VPIGVRLALAYVAALLPAAAAAQVGVASEIIRGRVLGPDSTPLSGARVTVVSVSTGATRTAVTRAGNFTILFRDGGNEYRVTVTYLGMVPANLALRSRPGDERLSFTVYMTSNPQRLPVVEVSERADARLESAFAAGGNERTLSPHVLERLPVNPGDLFRSAALIPGVSITPASDTSPAAFSIAAQPSVQNNITVDGMTFLFATLPQDAVASTRLILNSYDVSRGQFTGGQLVTTTRSGSNVFRASVNFRGRPEATQLARNTGGVFSQGSAQGSLTAGAGGPLGVGDRAVYFASGELESRTDAVPSLVTLRDPTLVKLGLAPDSLRRFESVLSGIGAAPPRVAPLRRSLRSRSALVRFDIDINETNALMLRGDFRMLRETGGRMSPYGVPNTGGTRLADGGGGMVMLSSVMGRFINEFRAYSAWEREESDPYVRAPLGIVTLASALDGGHQSAILRFGGTELLPRTSRATIQEASNELSFLTDSATHRVKLGVMVNRERAAITGAANPYGTFFYNSLADVENGQPALFARTIRGRSRLVGTDNGALYISHGWRRTAALEVTYGIRVEASRLADAPPFNPLVAAALDRQTRNFLKELMVHPRLGVSYVIGGDLTEPRGTISFGLGEFRGRIPSHLLQYVNSNAGFANSDSSVSCVGIKMPPVNWPSFVADTMSVPRECIATTRLPLGRRSLNVAIWDETAGAPRVWRSALNWTQRIGRAYRFSFEALYAHGIHNPVANDVNLDSFPRFTLDNEQRLVFAPPAAIVQATGATSLSGSRYYPFFGTAYEIGGGISSRTGQFTVQLTHGDQLASSTGQGLGYFNVGYTLMRSRDQSNGFPFSHALPNTSGDPRRREWGTSDLERRHTVTASGLVGLGRSLELGFIGRITSGPPYTPMVNGDVNGDGLFNDRAFVFSPASASPADTAVVNGMQRLLTRASPRTRRCLERQTDRIAGRNSCTTPWQPALDLQLNWRPSGAPLSRRVMISLVAVNTLTGLDALLHGGRLKGWGQPASPDILLLNVRGFDPRTRRFLYTVNEHFGVPSGRDNPFRVPFHLGLHIHARLGAAGAESPHAESGR
jgi:hypothetical protein